ncbi:SMC-Scp complex subunit ScpB [Sporomusa acidovorans]|uniref:Segregation and condensation protein B n=1 Tax=Sporomusa acidovorans (strain ATCC 49682 / DSM 3132 / Mol) TaxID=1123286 RepID=A0ABZ3J3L5_SPOA4|nr:SMC-Scp complex subunit ScpB [Sporomusa acidovorans]OZC20325.1 segregation and condensation protein B [Sporomusa acidovorans DSM 3132]SDD37478.1 segregation and condensation protein B [Sporomusa acidovorans]
MFSRHLRGAIEALLFASGQPLAADKIAGLLNIQVEQVYTLLQEMTNTMSDEERGLTIVEVAGGYQLCTKPELFPIIGKLAEVQDSKLSAAALETLAIVAFKQPVTRQEIEGIRGVKSDRVVTTLLDRLLIKEVGRKDAIGRPILYGTTNEFLQCFGLKNLEQLPDITNILTSDAIEGEDDAPTDEQLILDIQEQLPTGK